MPRLKAVPELPVSAQEISPAETLHALSVGTAVAVSQQSGTNSPSPASKVSLQMLQP